MQSEHLEPDRLNRIRKELLGWFTTNSRDLPWRRTRDPYAILVSEVMLQQTQVDRVIPYYERFLKRFPSVEALASAPVADVIRLWSGLGYNRRAVNLQRAAKAVIDEYGGQFPRDARTLRGLPGIGAYTAGAVAAFAFERDVAFLDTNMRRVVTRLVFGADPVPEAKVMAVAELLVPPGAGWSWNQGLIEFGALQCTARRPACVVCPLQQECAAFPMVLSAVSAKSAAPRSTQTESFEQSSRYFRGRIVEALRELPEQDAVGIDLAQLGPRVRAGFTVNDMPWLRGLLDGLQRDGLAVIAEEPPEYDARGEQTVTKTRVRLP